jgi:predicted nucleotidyltransferase
MKRNYRKEKSDERCSAMTVMPEQRVLDEVVCRVAETARPRRLVLSGSAARDRVVPDSDLDLLISMPEGTRRRATAAAPYPAFRDIGLPERIVAATEEAAEKRRGNPSLIIRPALDEGIALYAASDSMRFLWDSNG